MELDVIRIFVKVIQSGSYTRAASLLQLPKSSVSRAVTRLETESGCKLLMRTTRSITLTAAGRAFYDTCVAPLQQLEDARRSLSGKDSLIVGSVKITGPEDLGASILTPAIAELSKDHSGLKFEIHYTNQVVDLIRDGFDLAIRIGVLKDSQLKAHKLGEIKLILVATAGYLSKHSVKNPEDLLECDCLSYGPRYTKTKWELRSNKSKKTLNFEAKIICNQMSSLMNLAKEGAGIALVPEYLCQQDLATKKLVHVLPDFFEEGYPVWLLSPHSIQNSAKIKLLISSFQTRIKKLLS